MDKPRFAWRGLMIDVSRHFMSAAAIRRQLDAMEAVKLNVLHLHLTDNEGFRVESRLYPRLHEMGSNGLYYTQDEVRELVAYVRDRGIRVVPEVDVPGHTTGWLVGYPELASKPGSFELKPDMTAMHNALDPSKESTYEFLDRLFGEITGLFPDSYFHIGGDEVTGLQWNANPAIQAFMKQQGLKDKHQLQAYFNGRVREILRKHGKTIIGWDEILGDDLPKDVVAQTWRSSKMTARSAITGHPTIVSAGYYLDWMMPSDFHYLIDPLDTAAHGITREQYDQLRKTFVGSFLSEDNVVTGPTPLDDEQAGRILGGEAAMWSELVTEDSLDGRIWPRVAAIAERFWSPRSCRDVDSLYRRLSRLDGELEILDLRHYANRRKMIDLMTAQESTPIQTLADVVEPSKYYSRFFRRMQKALLSGSGAIELPLNELSDVVLPESLPARRFHEDIKRLLAGKTPDPALSSGIRTRLTVWARNHAEFQNAAATSFLLVEARGASSELKVLAELGLDAMDAYDAHKPPDRDWLARGRTLIEKHKKEAASSAGTAASFTTPPPPGGLVIAIVPAIEALVDGVAQITTGK